ncbi:MAG TPA: patatin-like phospholipase family protein [Steroidobacter sp.]|uniref:patatin-like phospholipase family protein n=1 Tax=Steroidobacter sp. TaxID=1978227 RepID=UPI002EDB6F13
MTQHDSRSVASILVVLLASWVATLHAEEAPATASADRVRVGLVLGGGGARGAAHVGVLRVLEEFRVPIDCVAGTSMGALVGAAYASGMSSEQIEEVIVDIDWTETFGGSGMRELLPVHLKSGRATYSNKLEFGIGRRGLLVPGGLVQSQQIDSLLRTIVGQARYHDSFDELPIPFRAVATDVGSGEMLVLGGGDLSVAMRASMAVPGAFAPVRVDDRVLVDGGLVRNLPVDIARDMCADVVIASSLVEPQPTVENLQSALAIVGQMIDVMIKNNERAQLASLNDDDVAILISLPGMTSADFEKAPTAIPLGDRAAREVASRLARYSVSPEEYARWRDGVARAATGAPKIVAVDEIRVEGLQRTNADVVRRHISSRVGEPLSEQQIVADAQRIFARGDYEKVDYNLERTEQGAVLQFLPTEKPWGPNYLRFDLGLMSSTGGDTAYILRADHSREWLNSLGARWSNALQIGRTALLETRLFQPLDRGEWLFVEPRLSWSREQQNVYRGSDRVARYDLKDITGGLDVGLSLGTWGEWRFGIERSVTDYTVDTGTLLLSEFENVGRGAWTSRFTIDTRDSGYVPSKGLYARLDVLAADAALGSDDEYERVELFVQHPRQFGNDLIYFEAGAGTDFDGSAPDYDLFTLGGAGQLSAFQEQELRGHEYAYGRVGYLRKVTDLKTLLGQSLYAGMSIEAGNMFDRFDGSAGRGAILGASIFFGGRTPLGPLLISLGHAESGHQAAYLQLGRPIKER